MRKPVEFARLDWDENKQPYSTRFADIYFYSSENEQQNGLAESRYVFLQHNQLAERWQAIKDGHVECGSFVIGETGFGTGLNFLATWQLWQEYSFPSTWLHFISIEKHPLRPTQLQQALSLWPELGSYSQSLLQQYPSLIAHGFYSLRFPDARIALTLVIHNVETGLKQCLQSTHPDFCIPFGHGVDAWFLDGFAPRKNPDMWSSEVLKTVAQLSHSNTTLSTFTAAGEVQRQLTATGFAVEKVPGFAGKREMLRAHFAPPAAKKIKPFTQWDKHPVPWSVIPSTMVREKHVAIIGAGLAGCHTARALADLGWRVTLLESSDGVATGGSGNAQGVVYAKLSIDDDALAQFNLSALTVAEQTYRSWWQRDANLGQACGVLQLAFNEKEQRVWRQCRDYFYDSGLGTVQFIDAEQASHIAGVKLNYPAIHFPSLGWIDPQRLCRQLIDHPLITLQAHSCIDSLQWFNDKWQLLDQSGQVSCHSETVVVSTANSTTHFDQTRELPLKKIRGQISYLPESNCINAIKTVICGESYITPINSNNNLQSIGATFNLHYQGLDVRREDHQSNIDSIKPLLPGLQGEFEAINPSLLTGRAGFRCTSPDYLPLAGPVHQYQQFIRDYAPLRVNARTGIHTPGQYWPGLYINVGHGSRGLAYTPLCARLLAAQINGDPLPVSQSLAEALNPARFTLRGLIRRHI